MNRWAGYYEVTPDENPIIGPIDEVQGLYCVAGFNGHGFMHSPVCGKLIREWISEGHAHTLNMDAYRYHRFKDRTVMQNEAFRL